MRKLIPCPFCDGNISEYNPCTICECKGIVSYDEDMLRVYGESIVAYQESVLESMCEDNV